MDELATTRNNPGPGAHDPSDCRSGQYLLSNFKNYGTAKYIRHNKKTRKGPGKVETPGPGTYQPPSEFGYLDMYKFTNRDPQISMMSTGRGQTPDKF